MGAFALTAGSAAEESGAAAQASKPVVEERVVLEMLAGLPRALPPVSDSCVRFEFLASPVRILGDGAGCVAGLEVEDNVLLRVNDEVKPRGLGIQRALDVDTVVFAIGDRVDEAFGLPLQSGAFAKNPNPRYPVEGISYEAFDPEQGDAIPDVFLAGWARLASTGLVGVARKDGEQGTRAVLQFLQAQAQPGTPDPTRLRDYLDRRP